MWCIRLDVNEIQASLHRMLAGSILLADNRVRILQEASSITSANVLAKRVFPARNKNSLVGKPPVHGYNYFKSMGISALF